MARILVVDDEPDVRAAMKASLEDAGHMVLQASDGGQALTVAADELPELIFLDLNMPRVDGFDALVNLKADDRTKEIPVVIVSAKGRPEDRLRTRAMGATDYINKPWADGELALRANLALMASARKLSGVTHGKASGLQQRITEANRPPARAATMVQPTIRHTIVFQQAPVAAPPPPRPRPAQPAAPPAPVASAPSAQAQPASTPHAVAPILSAPPAPAESPAPAREQSRLSAARFIVQHEYSAAQAIPGRHVASKSSVILRPLEDPDWVVRFETFDDPAAAAQALGDAYRFVYGVRGASPSGGQLAIFAEWELSDRANCLRFEANRATLFEMHRRQLTGLVSEWLLKRLDDTPRYTVLALFGDEDAGVRFRNFNPPPQFGAAKMQSVLGATELFGQCACRIVRGGV